MLLIPAIDLKDGHCVRLKQGDMDQSTTFGEDPGVMARQWVTKGARRLHLVDLNGAFAGQPKNEAAIRKILKEVGSEVDVQLGGGIRDLDTIERYLDAGLRYVIIGTAAVKNPGFLQDACTAFGGHIIVGLDARDANAALYRAKGGGRNRVELFDGAMHQEMVSRLEGEQALRRAIDDGEIVAFFQPELDATTGHDLGRGM